MQLNTSCNFLTVWVQPMYVNCSPRCRCLIFKQLMETTPHRYTNKLCQGGDWTTSHHLPQNRGTFTSSRRLLFYRNDVGGTVNSPWEGLYEPNWDNKMHCCFNWVMAVLAATNKSIKRSQETKHSGRRKNLFFFVESLYRTRQYPFVFNNDRLWFICFSHICHWH